MQARESEAKKLASDNPAARLRYLSLYIYIEVFCGVRWLIDFYDFV